MTAARLPGAALALTLVLATTACSRDTGAPDARDPEPEVTGLRTATPQAPAPLRTTARLGTVTGRLDKARRAPLKADVKAAVDSWFDGAYVAGPWPRTELDGAFTAFTRGAREDAERDARSLSNLAVGDRISGVTATRRAVTVDVLAVRGRPAGVTARVALGFDTVGERTRAEVVRGSLYLTRREGRWRVFGYDVTRGERGGR